MEKTTTIKIDDKLHKAAVDHIKENRIKGGFSAFVETLVFNEINKKNKAKINAVI